MPKYFIYALTIMLGLVLTPVIVIADVDCSPLDPRASLSKEREGKINASVNTVYKIAQVGLGIGGKLKDEINNLQKGATLTEQGQIKFRLLYLCCEMVAKDKVISIDKKVDLISKIMEIGKEDKSTAKRVRTGHKKAHSNQKKEGIDANNNGASTAQVKEDVQTNNKANITTQVNIAGGDYVAGNKTVNSGLSSVEVEDIVRRTVQEFKPELAQKYNDNFTIFGIDKSGLVVPRGPVPDGIEVNWKNGAAKYYGNEIMLVLPDIKIKRSNISFSSEYEVVRGISKAVNNQTYKLIATSDFSIELQVLGIDKDIVIVGLGFPLLNQAASGVSVHTVNSSGITMRESSSYVGNKNSYAELLKDHPQISPGRKSVLREIVSDILGVDYVANANSNELVSTFSRLSKNIVERRYIKTNCLNSGALGALQFPTPIIDKNHQLTEVGISVLKATAKDIKLGKARF